MELGSIMIVVMMVVVVLMSPFFIRGSKKESNIGIRLLKL